MEQIEGEAIRMTSREYQATRAAYEAYHNNGPRREFDDLEPRDQVRWLHAAEAVLRMVNNFMTTPYRYGGMRYRAVLHDADTTRERPLEIFGNDIAKMEEWAAAVLPKALDGGAVNIYETVEQHCKMIPKPKKQEPVA